MSEFGSSSKIFEGYKALGFVTNELPFIVRYVDKLDDLRIVTCVGRNFHSYNSHLRLLETSHAHESDVTCLASDSLYVFSAAGNFVYAWKHGHRWLVHTYKGHNAPVKFLLPFGPHLISIDESSTLCVWMIRSGELDMEVPFGNSAFQITALVHPSTYVNKILLGSKQGTMQLWNLRKQKMVYEYKSWGSPVLVIEQAPAVDIVAVGLEDGRVMVHNLKTDETLMSFVQEWGAVIALSFRTDGPPILASAGKSGNIALWDLEKRKLITQMRDIHSGAIGGCKFINHEPLMVTSSADNSVRVWIFDQNDDTGRILHEQEGHSSPPAKIRFHGSKGYHILSAGLDSTLRCFSTLSERLNRNFGFASYNRKYAKKIGARKDPNKMPPIIDFTSEMTREKEWDNIAAMHKDLALVTTWTYDKARMGEHKLLHKRFTSKKHVVATCLSPSSCGNFVTIGYNTGHVDRFNIQSGIFRLTYGKENAHEGPITGLETDGLNQIVVTASLDGIKFWRFKTGEFIKSISFDFSVRKMVQHKESSLLAIALHNNTIKIVDMETMRSVRTFPSHDSEVADMVFSIDARWLIISTMDSFLYTWDIPRGQLIDKVMFSSPCLSMSVSPTGEFLATSHANNLGVYLWSNVTIFTPVILRPLPMNYEARLIDLPTVKVDADDDAEENDENSAPTSDSNDEKMEVEISYKSPEQLSIELVTLSSLPTSRWKNLLSIDLIKKRNKPKEPVQAPKAAPFFIPTIAGITPTFDVNGVANLDDTNSRIIEKLNTVSSFGEMLLDCNSTADYSAIMEHLKKLGPSSIDAEIRSLDLLLPSKEYNGEELESVEERPILLSYFLSAMEQALKSKQDFELVQSYLGLFLKIHAEAIMKDREIVVQCVSLSKSLGTVWNDLQMKFHKSLCIVNYLRSAVV